MERRGIERRRARGRPRSPEVHDAILDAAIALIREVGYDAVSMDGIAARAGVGKAALYRRWPSKEALVVEALGRLVAAMPVPDTGTLAEDVRLLMAAHRRMYADPASGQLLSGIVAAMARSEAIAHAVRGGFVATRHDALRVALPWLVDHVEETWRTFGKDFWPYGIEANRPTWTAIGQYVHEQGLAPRVVTPEELFVPGIG